MSMCMSTQYDLTDRDSYSTINYLTIEANFTCI